MRWIALFAVLLLAASTGPVLAEDTAPVPPAPSEAELELLPDGQEVTEGIEAAEAAEKAREADLASPAAAAEREDSRFAFAGASVAEAQELLSTLFAPQLATLNSDPARFLSDAQLVEVVDESVATVKEEGDGSLLEASIPVQAPDEEGDLGKVDLSLLDTPEGYEPANPLTELIIPESAGEPIEIGTKGVAISQAGADGSQEAHRFGDENVFFGEVLTDTDLLVSPVSAGVELFNLLRSEDSPETVSFALEIPAGAELRPIGGWGAEVAEGDRLLTRIPAPYAVDAQGTEVPVELRVEGDSVVLEVAHRGADLAYPILLDPIVENNENWIYGQNHWALDSGAWTYDNEGTWWIEGDTHCIYQCFGPSNTRGLFISAKSSTYGAKQFGQWTYSAPNIHSFVKNVTVGPFNRDDHGCGSQAEPHNYLGIWSKDVGWIGFDGKKATGGWHNLPQGGQAAILGLGTGSSGFYLPCWRDLYAGGAKLELDDWASPKIDSVSGIPSGWFSDETPFTILAGVSDQGLGVRNVTIWPQGSPMIYDTPENEQCHGTKNFLCPTSDTADFPLDADSFDEGVGSASMVAHDPTGKTSGAYEFQTKVDRTPPEVALWGTLALATEEEGTKEQGAAEVEELPLSVYNLQIDATDGSNERDELKRSGVKDIRVFLDGVEQEVPWEPQSCPASSCPMKETYKLVLADIASGTEHTLKVLVEDQVGKVRVREIEFEYFPATGMKEEYLLHYFPLPDGEGNEAEEEHPDRPELAVNVATGNLVYREQDIEVEGPAVDLEVERYYNSMLPDSESAELGEGWTLAQTPDLEPVDTGGSPAPDEAELLEASGAIEEGVELPAEAGEEEFDPALQATLTKKAGGGYELSDETGESATSVAFDAGGQAEALLTEGHAKVDYTYDEGELAEIAVKDPAAASNPPEEEAEAAEPTPIFSASFGATGTGNGQFKAPAGAAIDPEGDLWIVDRENHRVQQFDRDGDYLSQVGSGGSGEGQLTYPADVAIDSEGDIWVADLGNHRLEQFSPSGEYLSKIEYGFFPRAVAVDEEDNILAFHAYPQHLVKLDQSGEVLETIGSGGSGPGELGSVKGIDLSPGGNVWVADSGNNRVAEFEPDGDFVKQFGLNGAGEGEFKAPSGIDVDEDGNVWVVDQENNRVQKFTEAGAYLSEFGGAGSGEGQLNTPTGVVAGSKGRLWIADTANNRVQEFSVYGARAELTAHSSSFGSHGTASGQFKAPAGAAIDPDGDVWIVDRDNHRVQQFSSSGEFISQFGSGESLLWTPSDLAIDSAGDVWVADTGNHVIREFSPSGEQISVFELGVWPKAIAVDDEDNILAFHTYPQELVRLDQSGEVLEVIGSAGSGPGQYGAIKGIDVGPGGSVWIADSTNNRVAEFDSDGDFVQQFGSAGTGDGQLSAPNGIDVTEDGEVWVADQGNDRVQRFTDEGEYVSQLGSEGSGEEELSAPTGIAADGKGRLWIADTANDRIQEWVSAEYTVAPQAPEPEDDPRVEVEVSDGLIEAIEGEEAGEHSYEYEDELLTSYEGPQGETAYEYDAEGRLTGVELANGTEAVIEYFATDGRVKSVAVDPAGAAPEETAHFEYDDGARVTTVTPSDGPVATYSIGVDGSVFRWVSKGRGPEFDDLAGSLYANRETQAPIAGGDHNLSIQAYSAEGIASIQVLANGGQLVDEKTCEQDLEKTGIECQTVINEWVTSTESHPPGNLDLEVLITDRLERTASDKFWVNIPQPPPPLPEGSPVPPKFADVLRFREEYGLEVVFPVKNEIELNNRIFNLIGAWWSGDPVARETMNRWGVPLRPEDAAEMEYRQRYLAHNGPLISEWGESTHPTSYAGYHVDHRAGGKIRVGFTDDMPSRVSELSQLSTLEAADRLTPFAAEPVWSLMALRGAATGFRQAVVARPDLTQLLTTTEIDVKANRLTVGTVDAGPISSFVNATFGPNTAIQPVFDPHRPIPNFSAEFPRERPLDKRLYAGDHISGGCTLGFGAWERNVSPSTGAPIDRKFALTAGHCYDALNTEVYRLGLEWDSELEAHYAERPSPLLGRVARNAFRVDQSGFQTDIAAIRLTGETEIPHWVYWSAGSHSMVNGESGFVPGSVLCKSGISTGMQCGVAQAQPVEMYYKKEPLPHWLIKVDMIAEEGDSGAPVVNPVTGSAVGIHSGSRSGNFNATFEYSLVAPLLPLEGPGHPEIPPGAAPGLDATALAPRLRIVDCCQ